MNNIFAMPIELQADFSYKDLYNNDRGAVFKDDYKSLLYYSIENEIIKVEKFIIAQNVDKDDLWQIIDSSDRLLFNLKSKMRNYHQEKDHILAPLIYILQKLEPDYKMNANRKEFEEPIFEYPNNIEIGFTFKSTNAFSRIYITDKKIALNSSNDDVENLVDTICIDGIDLYVIDTENDLSKNRDIVAYKLTKNQNFNSLRNKIHEKFQAEISGHFDK